LGIGDWGLGIGDWAQSPIPNPQKNNSYIIFLLNYTNYIDKIIDISKIFKINF